MPADEVFLAARLGNGFVDNQRLMQLLAGARLNDLLAVEIDFVHTDSKQDENAAVRKHRD